MDQQRLEQRVMQFGQALKKLHDAILQPKNEFTRDAVIQRFEFTYELAWKAMKLYLEKKDVDVRNAKDTLQAALLEGLIVNGNEWTTLHQMRNLMSHTYNENTAETVYTFVTARGVTLFDELANKLKHVKS